MPPQQTRKRMRKAPAAKTRKVGRHQGAKRLAAPATRGHHAGQAGQRKNRARLTHRKEKVIQEGLGQQTENKVILRSTNKRDTRARIIKAVSTPFNLVFSNQGYIGNGTNYTGLQAWSQTVLARTSDLVEVGRQLVVNAGLSAVSTTGAGDPPALSPPARFLLENCKMTLDFINRSTAGVTLKVFFLRQKRDTYYNYVTNTSQMTYVSALGLSYPWSGDPISAIQSGVAAANNQTLIVGQDKWKQPGCEPTESDIFNKFFAIEREVEIEMSTGGTHRMEINKHFDRILDASVYSTEEMSSLMGITEWILFQAVGAPVIASDGTTTVAPADIGYVQTLNYRATMTANALRAVEVIDTPLVQQIATNANQVNAGSGAVSSVVSA